MPEISVADIKHYEDNAKEHPEKQIRLIADSIREFGWQQPIIVDENNIIVAGHGRMLAYEYHGDEFAADEPWVKRENGETLLGSQNDTPLTPNQVKAYRLADNKLNESDWHMEMARDELKELDAAGFDIALTGFDEDIIEEPEPEDDYIPDVGGGAANTNEGDVYALGDHRLICGSALEAESYERVVPDTGADLLITDPPYNVDYEGKTEEALTIENDKMADAEFTTFLADAFKQVDRHLKEGRPYYVFHAESKKIEFVTAVKDTGWELKQCLIWVKDRMVLGRQDYQWQHEPILYGWKAGEAHKWYGEFDKVTLLKDDATLDEIKENHTKVELAKKLHQILENEPTSVIKHERPTASREHPTMKPVELVTKLLKNSSQRGDVVLDPFAGSGSTLIACEKIGRQCASIELDPKYCDVIVKRFEEYTDIEPELIANIHD